MDTCSSFFPASVPVFPATLSLQHLASLLPLSLFFGAVTCLSLLSLFSTCHLVYSCSGDCSPHSSSHAHIPPHSRATPHERHAARARPCLVGRGLGRGCQLCLGCGPPGHPGLVPPRRSYVLSTSCLTECLSVSAVFFLSWRKRKKMQMKSEVRFPLPGKQWGLGFPICKMEQH